MKPGFIVCLFCCCIIQQPLVATDATESATLVTNFWLADSAIERQKSQEQLINQTPDVATLYRWLKSGPTYSADVPLGQQESVRISADGTRFPYVVLIPESYDPARSYPVEFMLHGGVSRSEWEAGGGWWRSGYDSLKQADRIIVVPASWIDAFWWHGNQADSLPAILKTIKQTYNVDDNRVTLTGVSDGATGVYFFAFKQPTEWAAFLAYIGHAGVLRNPQSGGGYRLYFENLMAKPLYIVNGENDRLYPVSSVLPFIQSLEEAGVKYVFKAIENGGHNTRWLPDEATMIEQFKRDNPRDPFPDSLQWVADRTDRYNRNLWIRIDDLVTENQPGILQVKRILNNFDVMAVGVSEFTLLLSPEEIDFSQPVQVSINGTMRFNDRVTEDVNTLLKWARQDVDKAMLITAELNLTVLD